MTRNEIEIRLTDGSRVVIPARAQSSVGIAGAVPKKLRRFELLCPNGLHLVGVITDTEPALVYLRSGVFPAWALTDEGFLGVMANDSGGASLLAPGAPRIKVGCRDCDYLDGWLTANDLPEAKASRRVAVVLKSA